MMTPSHVPGDHGPCCVASRLGSPQDGHFSAMGPRAAEVASRGTIAASDMVRVEGGEFLMGTEDPYGFAADGEGPVRAVTLKPLWIDAYAVANARFAAFVEATGYITDAERYGWSFVFGGPLVAPGLRRKLASSRGHSFLHRRSYGSPDGARLLERRGFLLLVGGDEAAHRGRVGVCSPWRA